MISVTLSELWAVILAVSGGVITIAGAISWIVRVVRSAKQPLDDRIQRLEQVEDDVCNLKDECVKMHVAHEDDIEAQTIMMKAVKHLLSHEINGNHINTLEDSVTEIDEFLLNHRGR